MTRAAPPRLVYGCGPAPRAVGLCLLLLGLLGAAVLLLWAFTGAGPRPWPAAAGLLLWAGVAACALRCWRRWPEGWLEWDGGQWWLRVHGAPQALAAAPRMQWDGQGFVLLSVALAVGGRRWLWLRRSSAPALWGDLRRAVYWRPRPAERA